MPPKPKFTKEEIVEAALALVSERGMEALTARDLSKGRVLESSPINSREAAECLAEATGADVVQVIGSRFVLYRRREKDPAIVLPRVR